MTTSDLDRFHGSEEFTRYNGFLLTDGARYVAENGGAWWLMDIIISVWTLPKARREEFWTVKFNKTGDKGRVTIDDGNGNIFYSQNITYTDFPLDEVKFFVVSKTIMLPTEY